MRIGINVPNDLLKRLEPLKQMTNVSQICRDAIQTWIATYERAIERASQDGMEDIALRLRDEIDSYKIDWEGLGNEDAKIWAQLASLKDFENLFHNMGVAKRRGRATGIWCARIIPGTREFGERAHEHKEWFERQYEIDKNTNHQQQAEIEYTRGWLSYITAIWEMVKRGAELKKDDRSINIKTE